MCVVFAETEIIGLLASGVLPEDIVAGRADVDRHADGRDGRAERCRRRSSSPAAWRWCRAWNACWPPCWAARPHRPAAAMHLRPGAALLAAERR